MLCFLARRLLYLLVLPVKERAVLLLLSADGMYFTAGPLIYRMVVLVLVVLLSLLLLLCLFFQSTSIACLNHVPRLQGCIYSARLLLLFRVLPKTGLDIIDKQPSSPGVVQPLMYRWRC